MGRTATVMTEPARFALKSLPEVGTPGEVGYLEEGFIVARPLPYGLILERRDKGTKMGMELEMNQGRRKKSIRQNESETQTIQLETLSAWMANHDFSYCITDHNLTTKDGQPLDFHNQLHVQALDPKVGIEIDRILSDLNELEEDEESLEDFTPSAISSSQAEEALLKPPTLTPVT